MVHVVMEIVVTAIMVILACAFSVFYIFTFFYILFGDEEEKLPSLIMWASVVGLPFYWILRAIELGREG